MLIYRATVPAAVEGAERDELGYAVKGAAALSDVPDAYNFVKSVFAGFLFRKGARVVGDKECSDARRRVRATR